MSRTSDTWLELPVSRGDYYQIRLIKYFRFNGLLMLIE